MKQRLLRAGGFTLIEMAIVLLIMALAIGGGLAVISGQAEYQKFKETQKVLDEAKEALIGYAASRGGAGNPYLPCPDRTTGAGANDGAEDRVGGAGSNCTFLEGNLPWVTLGLTGLDGWNNRIRYRVSQQAFATGFNTGTVGALTVNNSAGANLATSIPVVLVSHGPNGWGAISASGTAIGNPPAANVNETENTGVATNAIYVSNPPVEAGLAGGEFDDIVTWMPFGLLVNRMLQAGVCVKTVCP